MADPAGGSNFPDAVYVTPIYTEDHTVVEKTFMLEDSTFRTAQSSFTDILAEKHPLLTTDPPYLICSNRDWNSCFTSANNLMQSNFISDLPMGELSCILSPQVELALQDYPDPTSQLFSCPDSSFGVAVDAPLTFPVNKSLFPDLVIPNFFDDSLAGLQILEGGIKETQELIAYGDDHVSSEEETRLVATSEGDKLEKMDLSFSKTREVTEVRHQNCGSEGEIGREHGRVVYPEQFEQPEMLTNNVSAAFTADIAWKNEAEVRMMNACGKPKGKRARTKQSSRRVSKRKQLVDLRTLLIQCAEAVGSNDFRNANDYLMQIRKHSSPFGNAPQRKAHYFAKALEARLAGTGSAEFAALVSKRIPNANTEASKLLLSACPFMKVSNFFTIETIMKLAETATTIHIIHFGVPYGLQWTTLIRRLSSRPGNPPMLRLTGIDHDPQPGLHSAARVEQAGRFLANCCKQFNVPFEYNPITTKWESIQLEDLKICRDEVIVVNCLYRLRHVVDETADLSSPRDNVLNLVRKINPNIFIHGIVNGSYNAPFFVSRFREAIYYFSTMFNMLEEIAPFEDQERMVLEENVFGKEILNVVACEGSERVERPETYKQWQVRNLRAGLRQLPLNQEMLQKAKAQVKLQYHKDFLVDEDKNWMLQGWKGRILFALSFWRPAKDP
ncbi:hypothetical protein DITRI_Ditri05aG0032800 [Diplodiscus trichospermus]